VKITVTKDAGYCFGVRDAVNMAYSASEKYGDVYMLGSIVHNEKVVNDLNSVGAKIVSSLNDVPKDSPILFRAHGTVNHLWEDAKNKNMKIIDATCPLVYEIHHEVKKIYNEGRQVIVIGDHGHDEVIAICDHLSQLPVVLHYMFSSLHDESHIPGGM
jgi:4-hydroxy-3-methylbut-2-enyl diphosphate reductase